MLHTNERMLTCSPVWQDVTSILALSQTSTSSTPSSSLSFRGDQGDESDECSAHRDCSSMVLGLLRLRAAADTVAHTPVPGRG